MKKDAQLAEDLLDFVHLHPKIADDDVTAAFMAEAGSAAAMEAERVNHIWTRLTTEFPHMFAVASARDTLGELDLSGHLGANAHRTPDVSFLLYNSWKTAVSEVQEFLSDAQMSPGTLGLVLQILLNQRTVPKNKLHVGNPYHMFHPERHKARLQALVNTAETVLLPVYSGKASAWAMCELTRGESMSPACTIHHWHKHKHDALGKLEQT